MEHLSLEVVLDSKTFSSDRALTVAQNLHPKLEEYSDHKDLQIELRVRCSDADLEWVSTPVTVRVEIPSGRNAMIFRDDLTKLVRKVFDSPVLIKAVAVPVFISRQVHE